MILQGSIRVMWRMNPNGQKIISEGRFAGSFVYKYFEISAWIEFP